MPQPLFSRFRLVLILTLTWLALPALVPAGVDEDFSRLDTQCWEQIKAGNLSEAERLALELKRMAEGPMANNHVAEGNALYVLGTVYGDQGRYAEAEPLLQQALDIDEKVFGPEHPYVAHSLNNLANVYENQGRYRESEQLHKRALRIREEVLGPDHPRVADSLNNLANVYHDQGRYAEAEPLIKRSLAIREKVLGPDHPDVAISLNNLANLYCAQGFAAELLFQVFADRYERGSLLVTSNLPFSEWQQVFQGERMTAALLDRLTHHCEILEMNGESYRFRESMKQKRPAAKSK